MFFWAQEAKVKRIRRQIEAADAAMLPHMDNASRKQYLDGLRLDLENIIIDDDDVAKIDKENSERMVMMEQKLERRRARLRAERAAGIKPTKQRPPKRKI